MSTNIISPTGCVHRAENDRFSAKGSRRTLCNHRNYYESSASGYWHNWPDTNKPVTCKRCLKLIEPKVTARRHDFKWLKPDLILKEVYAEVTINEWFTPQGAVVTIPDRERTFILYSGKYHTGMKGLKGNYVPKMSEDRRQWLHLVAQAVWSATFGREMNFTWATLD